MIYKIRKAVMEGNLLRKAIRFIPKLPTILLERLDWILGCAARFIYARTHRVRANQIMFIPFQGDFTCNPKYIAEELLRRTEGQKLDIVFSARAASIRNKSAFPKPIRLVEQYSSDYYQEIAKSKLIVANSVEFLKKPVPKKRKQILIETWHGSLGIKRFGEKENHGKAWVAAAKRCGRLADYIISNSTFEDWVYKSTFWSKTPILRYGHPRNDVLFSKDNELKEAIRSKVLGEDKALYHHHLVLYGPTFRDNHSLSSYRIDFDQLSDALADRFGGEWTILVRLHPTVRKAAKRYTSKKNVIDVTSYPDIQELMLISDIAITDYSSWIYDFMLMHRPGFIFAADVNSYENERGFYYPLSSTPFPIASSSSELIDQIAIFDEETYLHQLERFLEDKGCIDDGEASRRVVDKILELMGVEE